DTVREQVREGEMAGAAAHLHSHPSNGPAPPARQRTLLLLQYRYRGHGRLPRSRRWGNFPTCFLLAIGGTQLARHTGPVQPSEHACARTRTTEQFLYLTNV